MIRRVAVALLLIASAFAASNAGAYPISPNNPYRSFNITGINYGSMQWERDHRGFSGYRTYNGYGVHRGFFRR